MKTTVIIAFVATVLINLVLMPMLIPMLLMSTWYNVRKYKVLISAIILTVFGVIGTYSWFWVETGRWGGRSFFGAVFIIPISVILVSKLLRIPYGDLMDLCAPAECVMLILMKVKCIIDDCCEGRVLFNSSSGTEIVFPSQIVELANALILGVVLIFLSKNEKRRGTIYVWYLLLYGITRFILNWFRAENDPFALGLTAGCFWSLCSIIVATVFLITIKKLQTRKKAIN